MMGKCFANRCKWNKQGPNSMHCTHPNAIKFISLTKPCPFCRRKPNDHKRGCGECIGRGTYTYPTLYEDCDCGGYELERRK